MNVHAPRPDYEVLIDSAMPDRLRHALVEVGGFVELPEAASADRAPEGRESTLLVSPAAPHAAVRLTAVPAEGRSAVRANAMPWDTGGIFDVYFRCRGLDRLAARLQSHGWQGFNDVVGYTVGGVTVREIILRDTEGVALCLVELPEGAVGDDAPSRGGLGPPFNVTSPLPLGDMAAARQLFVDRLGWTASFAATFRSAPPGDSPAGLPRNLAVERARHAAAYVPDVGAFGSVQFMAYEGLDGRDLSARLRGPARGIVGVRHVVADARALAARAGEAVLVAPTDLEIAPYGAVTVAVLAMPGGARLELLSPRAADF